MNIKITLPPSHNANGLSIEEAIRQRRSTRSFSSQFMTLEELSRLLQHSVGVTGENWGQKLHAAPSAGATYPIETYVVIHRVEGVLPGLYRYAVLKHALELLQAEDLRNEVVQHGMMQEFLGQANLVIIFTTIFQRIFWKYQERSYQYALLEAGHLGQNVYLVGTSLGLGVCAVGAFQEESLNAMIGADRHEETAVYMLAVGKVQE